MYDRTIDINKTLEEVCNAVSSAEDTVKEYIKLYYHNVNEEFITTLFYNHIKYRLRVASQNKLIEDAFLEDLKTALPSRATSNWDFDKELCRKSEGLIADIVLHNKQEEGKTGGDFGLLSGH